MFSRPLVRQGGMIREMRAGDGVAANLSRTHLTLDSNQTLSVAMIAGGLISREGLSANRTDTTPTAAELIAAFPEMDIGDTLVVIVSNFDNAQTVTLTGGTDVTDLGNRTVPADSSKHFVLEKTSATEMNLIGL